MPLMVQMTQVGKETLPFFAPVQSQKQ
jgi:hypothetical protein